MSPQPNTLRILRAFAWMRWRVLMNALERSGARDTVERLSLAVEQIGPIVAIGLIVPSAVLLAALGAFAGFRLGTGQSSVVFMGLRIVLFTMCVFAVAGPLLMPSAERPNAVRLLLLPIPRRTLYLVQVFAAVSDPWMIVGIPAALAVAAGLAASGAFSAALIAAIAALLFIVCLIGLSALATLLFQLVVRDRRRGELIALLFIVVLPAAAMLPGLFDAQRTREERQAARAARKARGGDSMPVWLSRTYELSPSQQFANAVQSAAQGEHSNAVLPIVGLAAACGFLHTLGVLTFGRLLDSPASSGRRRSATAETSRGLRLRGLSHGSAAVAIAQIRLAVRTPRGRSSALSPLVVFLMFAILMRRTGSGMDLGAIKMANGFALATFGSAVSLLSVLPFAANQFAIDGSGLTRALLSPLATAEILNGKAVGLGIVGCTPALVCMVLAYAMFPAGSPALWICLPLGLAATYILAAPAAAALSAIFPRTVNLNSIGRGSNAHGAAGLLTMMAFVLAGSPPLLLTLGVTRAVGSPSVAPLLLVVWLGIVLVVSRMLFSAAGALFDRRRENLAMLVS